MLLIVEFGPYLCNLGCLALCTILFIKALDFLKFLYVKEKLPTYPSDEEDPDYVS